MGRHAKQGLDYFSIDCILSDQDAYVILKHRLEGYGALTKLKTKIYGIEGYYCEWTERSKLIFARDNSIDVATLNAIVETCLEEGIFSRDMLTQHQVLTGLEIQQRFVQIVTATKRINRHIEGRYSLLSGNIPEKPVISPEEKTISSEETAITSGVGTQSKVKYSTVKESKVNETVPTGLNSKTKVLSTPAGAGAGDKAKADKKKDKSEGRLFWQPMVDTWFYFYRRNFNGNETNLLGRNSNFFGQLYDLLKNRAGQKKIEWTEVSAIEMLEYFLNQAFTNDPAKWLASHFTLENLVKQFDPVYARAKEEKQKKTFFQELDYIMGRYKEGKLDPILVTHELYRKLEDRKLIPDNYRERFKAKTPEDQEVAAVMAFLEANKDKPPNV